MILFGPSIDSKSFLYVNESPSSCVKQREISFWVSSWIFGIKVDSNVSIFYGSIFSMESAISQVRSAFVSTEHWETLPNMDKDTADARILFQNHIPYLLWYKMELEQMIIYSYDIKCQYVFYMFL